MCSFRKLLFILTVIIILPAGLFAQTGSSDPEAVAPASERTDGFSVSIDLRLSGTSANIIPGLSAILGIPMSLSSDSVTFTPLVGFLYFFDVWTDVHSSYYVPLGLEVVYNPANVGLEVLYYPSVGVTNGIHLLSATVRGEVLLLEVDGFSMNFGLGIGPVFVFNTTGNTILLRVNSGLLLRYRI